MEVFRKDKSFVIDAISQNGRIFKYLPDDWKKNRTFNMFAISANASVQEWINADFKKDDNFTKKALTSNPRVQEYFLQNQKKDPQVIQEAVTKAACNMEHIPPFLKRKRKLLTECMRLNGECLQQIPDDMKREKVIVREAVRNNGESILWAPEQLQKNEEIVFEAIKQNPMLINRMKHVDLSRESYVGKKLTQMFKGDDTLHQQSQKVGRMLAQAPKEFMQRKDKSHILMCVNDNKFDQERVTDVAFCKKWEIVSDAVLKDGYAIQQAPWDMQQDAQMVNNALYDDKIIDKRSILKLIGKE